MTKWRGFIKESKSYMNHPDYWPEWLASVKSDWTGEWTRSGKKDVKNAKIDFWRKFPRAWMRFHWFILCDWVKKYCWWTPRNWIMLKWRRKDSR